MMSPRPRCKASTGRMVSRRDSSAIASRMFDLPALLGPTRTVHGSRSMTRSWRNLKPSTSRRVSMAAASVARAWAASGLDPGGLVHLHRAPVGAPGAALADAGVADRYGDREDGADAGR